MAHRAMPGEGLHASRGLVAELAARGMRVDYKTVWEFVHAEGLTHKKRR
jgi:putative transposase